VRLRRHDALTSRESSVVAGVVRLRGLVAAHGPRSAFWSDARNASAVLAKWGRTLELLAEGGDGYRLYAAADDGLELHVDCENAAGARTTRIRAFHPDEAAALWNAPREALDALAADLAREAE
jgi:hypothetical protein